MERRYYTGESRTTKWRRKNQSEDQSSICEKVQCYCKYHQIANSDSEERNCTIHDANHAALLTQSSNVEELPDSGNKRNVDRTESVFFGSDAAGEFELEVQCVSPNEIKVLPDPPGSVAALLDTSGSGNTSTFHSMGCSHKSRDVHAESYSSTSSDERPEHGDSGARFPHTEGLRIGDSAPYLASAEYSSIVDEGSGSQNTSNTSSDSDGCCGSDSSFNSECYEAHFLEEGRPEDHDVEEMEEEPALGDFQYQDPDDPDDPDDSFSDESGESSETSSEGSENDELANYAHENLQAPVIVQNAHSKGHVILLQLANVVRHNLTFECILDSFRNLNVVFGHNFFPSSKKKLWSTIQLNRVGMLSHVYCGRKDCGNYIGRKDRLENFAVCNCGYRVPVKNAKFFVTLDFRNQLKRFLSIPGIWNKLQYRQTRQKQSPTSIEDVYDGSQYKHLQENNGPLSSQYNFSYVFNLDGCKPSKRGSLKMWPLFARLNELPPELRQKFHFLVALYVDTVNPNFQSFLRPFVKQANKLSSRGIVWKPDGINEVRSIIIPLCFCVDSDARYGILNMSKFNSHYGCTYCNHQGEYAGGSMRYPYLNENEEQAYEDRTHASMTADMIRAHESGVEQTGHKGLTQLLLLQHHDLREGQAADDLHPDHEGCAADLTELLLTVAPRIDADMPNVELLRLIDERLLSIKTPSRIARKPASIKSRGSFKGSEWRNWLFFYGVPCLSGLISPQYVDLFSQLSHACYLLSQDAIEPGDTQLAERLFQRYVIAFQEKFGLERMKFNLHVTTAHKVNSVRKLGPIWASSTYNFESLNGKLVKKVTSPKGAVLQVITRYMLYQIVNAAVYDEEVPESVQQRLRDILSKYKLKGVYEVAPHSYAVGKPTTRAPSPVERNTLLREGFDVHLLDEYGSLLLGSTRYTSSQGRAETGRSRDSLVYTTEDTFCNIINVVVFRDDEGEEHCGLFVSEHDVARVLPIARHISVLRDNNNDLFHFISFDKVRFPAIEVHIQGLSYATPLPNCLEID